MKVLVLAIFPRGEDDTHSGRQVNMKANKLIAQQADGEMVHFLDINDAFLTDDRILTREGAQGLNATTTCLKPIFST